MIGEAAMAAVLLFVPFSTGIPLAVSLILRITLAAVTYVVSVLSSWWIAGGPDGAESYLVREARRARALKQA